MTTSTIYPNGSAQPVASLSAQNLLLDSDIRDWVVLPLLIIMIVAGLLRNSLGQLLRGSGKPLSCVESKTRNCIQRSQRFRGGGSGFLTKYKWEARRQYMSNRDDGSTKMGLLREMALKIEQDKESEAANGATVDPLEAMNPMAMMDGMKGNMAFMVQNMVMMQGISHFFKGYVLVKVPFSLTNGFKQMFQRGLDLQTLETSYVSSVSWYFLVMYGLRAFFRLVIGDVPQETQESVQLQQSFGMLLNAPAGPQKFEAEKALKNEAEAMEIARYYSTIDDAEKRLLGKRFPKKKTRSSARNPGDDIFGFSSAPKKVSKSKANSKKTK